MPRSDLLEAMQHGQARAGDHLIDITPTPDGRLTYTITHIEGAHLATATREHDTFDETLMHALGHLAHELREHAGGDDTVEGPAMDHEIATNLLDLMCEARGRDPEEFTPDPSLGGGGRTTLGELHAVLQQMLAEGINPRTPIRLRTHPREPNVHTGTPNTAALEDVWHHPDERVIYLDEPGI